jgi:P27 family predicted phage terminase small subunit
LAKKIFWFGEFVGGIGRPRKPTEKHDRDGSLRQDRHGGRKNQPKADGVPTPPDSLTVEAKAHWNQVVPALVESGVAKAIDAPALAAMCESWADLQAARRLKGYDLQEKRQRQMLINAALRAWRDLAARFGLTPADRAKLEVAPDDEEGNAFDKFMRQQLESPSRKN